MDKDKQLIKELKIRGISENDAEELKDIAERLGYLGSFERSNLVKSKFVSNFSKETKRPFWPRIFIPALAFVLFILVLGGGTIFASQKSLPGDALYPVKRLSEDVGAKVNPNLDQEIIVRRSEEVKELVEKKEDPELVKETLGEFTKKRRESKEENGALDESLRNLEEAKNRSSDSERRELERVLEDFDGNGEVKGEKGEESKDENSRRDSGRGDRDSDDD